MFHKFLNYDVVFRLLLIHTLLNMKIMKLELIFRNNELVFLKLKILSVILERNKNDILERNKETNDTISCLNIVEAAVEKWSSCNFANVHDF